MMVISNANYLGELSDEGQVPSVLVVDPRFDAYASLAASARTGRIGLHFRSSGADAIKLARKIQIDAWLIASELDDMSGHDLVGLLQSRRGMTKVAMVETATPGSRQRTVAEQDAHESGVDAVLSKPITVSDLEELLGLPLEERSRRLSGRGLSGSWAALPVSVGAAVVAIAVLMIG